MDQLGGRGLPQTVFAEFCEEFEQRPDLRFRGLKHGVELIRQMPDHTTVDHVQDSVFLQSKLFGETAEHIGMLDQRSCIFKPEIREEIAQTVQTMIQASSCCEELKNAGRKWLDAIGTAGEHAAAEALLQEIRELCEIQGLIVDRKKESLDDEIEAMIAERQAARKAKDFARADEIRDELLAKGIILEDTREGVKWKRA